MSRFFAARFHITRLLVGRFLMTRFFLHEEGRRLGDLHRLLVLFRRQAGSFSRSLLVAPLAVPVAAAAMPAPAALLFSFALRRTSPLMLRRAFGKRRLRVLRRMGLALLRLRRALALLLRRTLLPLLVRAAATIAAVSTIASITAVSTRLAVPASLQAALLLAVAVLFALAIAASLALLGPRPAPLLLVASRLALRPLPG
jgi:hypothetical protein